MPLARTKGQKLTCQVLYKTNKFFTQYHKEYFDTRFSFSCEHYFAIYGPKKMTDIGGVTNYRRIGFNVTQPE